MVPELVHPPEYSQRRPEIMRSKKVIHVVSCHAEGEVGDVIVGGVTPPPGGNAFNSTVCGGWDSSATTSSMGSSQLDAKKTTRTRRLLAKKHLNRSFFMIFFGFSLFPKVRLCKRLRRLR